MAKPPTARQAAGQAIIVLLGASALFAWLIVAACIPRESSAAPRRPIPRAANAVDQAAGAFEELCEELREVVQDARRQGVVTGAFGVYVVGVPLLTVEWKVDLPAQTDAR